MAKEKTLKQAETALRRAIQFEYNLGNDDKAEEFESMTPQQYAEHRGFTIVNPISKKRRKIMPNRKPAPLKVDLMDENEELRAALEEANQRIEELEDEREGALSALSSVYGLEIEEEEEEPEEDELDEEEEEEPEYAGSNGRR